MTKRNHRRGNSRNNRGGRDRYERTDRVGELLRQIIAEELMRIDDEELAFVTVSGVEVDNELYRATVYLSTLDLDEELDLRVIEAHRNRLRRAINDQAHLRKTPDLRFALDPGLVQGTRVDAILRDLADEDDAGAASPGDSGSEEE